jgi:hypothetical protein
MLHLPDVNIRRDEMSHLLQKTRQNTIFLRKRQILTAILGTVRRAGDIPRAFLLSLLLRCNSAHNCSNMSSSAKPAAAPAQKKEKKPVQKKPVRFPRKNPVARKNVE